MYAQAGRQQIYFETRGNEDGPALVMIRGLGRFALHWGAVLVELERDFHLVLFDNRGTGRSSPVRWPFTIADLSDDVAAVLDAAQVGRAHVVGTSLGGMVAQQFALDHGGRLDRLVLLSTTAGGRAALWPPLSPYAQMAFAARKPVRDKSALQARLVLGDAFCAAHPEVIETWSDIAARYPVSARTLAYQLIAARLFDASRHLDRVGARTLVVSCERDRLMPPENSRLLARAIRFAELRWLPGESHDVTTSVPTEMARMLREFLLPRQN